MSGVDGCAHLDQVNDVEPATNGCEECTRIGSRRVHLRLCMTCGHVGCCDDSRNRHASSQFRSTGHPIIQSFEPGEQWRFCYIDDIGFVVEGARSFEHR